MIDYSQWPERSRKTLRLKLDPKNVRLNKLQIKGESDIIKYMLENERVMNLARSIAKKGYLPNEAPIVVVENGQHVVIEGNRRVTACKILLSPNLAPKTFQSKIKKLVAFIEPSLLDKLTVIVAPNRPATKVVVHNRHTGTELRERWDSGKQDVFFQRDIQDGLSIDNIAEMYDASPSEIKESIIRYNMYEEAKRLNLLPEEKADLFDEENFPITTFARIWAFKELRDFIGVTFDAEGGVVKLIPEDEFQKRFGFLVSEVLSENLDSRTINGVEEVKKYIANLKKNSMFDLDIVCRIPSEQELQPKTEKKEINTEELIGKVEYDEEEKPVPKSKVQTALINKSEGCNTGVEKIDGIFKELQRLDVKSHKHAVSVLLRTFFESTLSELLERTDEITNLIAIEQVKNNPQNSGLLKRTTKFIETLGCTKEIHQQGLISVLTGSVVSDKDWAPSLRYMLDYVALDRVKLISGKLKSPIRAYLSGKVGLGHNDFNDFVHNQYMSPTEEALRDFWKTFSPVFRSILRQLDLRQSSTFSQKSAEQAPDTLSI